MAYIGQGPFNEFSTIPTKDTFTGDGSTTVFDMAVEVPSGSENALEVFVDNIRQEPGSGKAFTLGLDGSNVNKRITFTAAPANGAAIYVINDKTNTTTIVNPIDLGGVELILDADNDTSITADTDDQIDFKIGSADHLKILSSSGDTVLKPMVDAKDIIFQQFDGNKVFEINDGNFVSVGGNAAAPGEIRIYEDTDLGTNYSGFKVGNLTGSVAYQLPLADGNSGQALATNGSGVLSWATVAANTPTSADGQALGSASLEWSDLFLADAAVINFGADQDINITHVADTGLTTNGTFQATTITATTAFVPDASDGAALGTTALEFSDLFLADGAVINFGADQDINLTHVADTGLTTNGDFSVGDDLTVLGGQFDLKTNSGSVAKIKFYCESGNAHAQTLQAQPHSASASDVLTLPTGGDSTLVSRLSTDTLTNKTLTSPVINTGTFGTSILPTSADGTTLGSATKEFSDLFLADASTIQFGADQDVIITHVADTGILLSGTNVIQFNDASQNIGAPSNAILDINATDEIELNATLVDVNANLDVSGTITSGGVITGTAFTAGSAVLAEAELELLDGLTAGTAIASKVVTTDANIDSTGMRNLTISGELDAATGDFSGAVDVAGALTTAAITASGIVTGTAFTAGSAVLAEAELELLDGLTAGTAIASKVVTTDANIDTTGMRNLTISGELDAATGDFSGAVDVAGAITTSDGMIITTADNTNTLQLISTDADANSGPRINFFRDSSSPADNDSLGQIHYSFKNSAGDTETAINVNTKILDVTDGTEDAQYMIEMQTGGAFKNRFMIGTETVFNEDSADLDFRVEGSSNTHSFFVDAGDDHVNIGAAGDLGGRLNVHGNGVFQNADQTDTLTLSNTDADANVGPRLKFGRNSSSPADADLTGDIRFETKNDADQDVVTAQIKTNIGDVRDGNEYGEISFYAMTNGTLQEYMAFGSNAGNATVFNEQSQDLDFRVESDNDANAFFVQGSDGHVGLGLSAPAVELHLKQTNNHPTIRFENSKTAGDTGDFLGKIEFEGNDENSGADGVRAFIHGATENSTGATSLRIGTASSSNAVNESFRITSDETVRILSENFGASIGTTNFGIEINKNAGNIFINHATNGTGLSSHYAFINDNGVVGSITTNGSATAYNTSSDYRLKENVVTDWDATTRLKQLKPSRFNFKVDADTTVDGFLAHEVSSIVPEAVAGDKDGTEVYIDDNEQEQTRPVYQAIDQSKLVPLLVKTIQELEARITTLEG